MGPPTETVSLSVITSPSHPWCDEAEIDWRDWSDARSRERCAEGGLPRACVRHAVRRAGSRVSSRR